MGPSVTFFFFFLLSAFLFIYYFSRSTLVLRLAECLAKKKRGYPAQFAPKVNTMGCYFNKGQSLPCILESASPEIQTSEISSQAKSQSARFSNNENPEQQNSQTTRFSHNRNRNQQNSRMKCSKCDVQQNFFSPIRGC
jgi:hypothetical protein